MNNIEKQRFFEEFMHLPNNIQQEVIDFTHFIIKKQNNNFELYDENQSLINDIQFNIENSQIYEFLKEEEDLYSLADAKEIYKHEKR